MYSNHTKAIAEEKQNFFHDISLIPPARVLSIIA
jgi:hypothetical protein